MIVVKAEEEKTSGVEAPFFLGNSSSYKLGLISCPCVIQEATLIIFDTGSECIFWRCIKEFKGPFCQVPRGPTVFLFLLATAQASSVPARAADQVYSSHLY